MGLTALPDSVSLLWRRFLAILRALLCAACLAGLLSAPSLSVLVIVLMAVLLITYSALSLLWRSFEQLAPPLLSLVLDTIFFLLCLAYGGTHSFWLSAFFCFYLLLTAALLHTWREVLMESGVCLSYFVLVRPLHWEALWPMVLLMGMFACIITLHQRTLADRLTGASQQAVVFRAEAEHAREAERQRIAADFHDGPLQSFISFQMRLEVVRKMLQRDIHKGIEELSQLQELCRGQVAELRAFVKSMRPVQYGDTIGAALRRLADDFQKNSGIPVSLSYPEPVARMEIANLKELLPIIREALHNVQKHSHATRVTVMAERTPHELRLEIDDDGEGFQFGGLFDLSELERLRIGPMSIQRRVRNLEGEMSIESRPGRGSTLRVQVPVRETARTTG